MLIIIFIPVYKKMKALLKIGIRGVTVSDVRGFGAQGGLAERQGGKLLTTRTAKTLLFLG